MNPPAELPRGAGLAAALPEAPRLLVLRGGALGDFILTLPVLAALRRRWPRADLEWLGHPRHAALGVIAGLIGRVRDLESAALAAWFAPDAALPDAERAYLQSFDLVLSYLSDNDGELGKRLRRAGARAVLAGAPRVAAGHAVEHFLAPLAVLGLEPGPRPYPRLDWPAERRAAGRRRIEALGLRGPAIALHPGSGSPRKNWPAERFAALSGLLAREGMGRPFFLAGEADAEAVRALARLAPGVPLLRDLSLPEVADALAACAGYAGNDSGITHLAAALGRPVVALFGPTDPRTWAPRGPRVRVLGGDPPGAGALAAIAPEAVREALRVIAAKERMERSEMDG